MMEKKDFLVQFSGNGYVSVAEGQSLLEAARAGGVPLFHRCGGQAKCSTCRVLVLKGISALLPPNEREKRLGEKMRFPCGVRLACQTRVSGNGVSIAPVVGNGADVAWYVGNESGEATEHVGREKALVLFFLDIRNFTIFVETHRAFDVIRLVRKLFKTFYAIIDRNGGKIVETTGDGFYAVFGLKNGQRQSVSGAVKAGYAILSELEGLNENYFKKSFCQPVAIGIGIHAGPAIEGSIKLGSDVHRVVMGYAVNIAARLQNATKELNNNFIISDEVYRLLSIPPEKYQKRSIGLRGVSRTMQVYLLGEPYAFNTSDPLP